LKKENYIIEVDSQANIINKLTGLEGYRAIPIENDNNFNSTVE